MRAPSTIMSSFWNEAGDLYLRSFEETLNLFLNWKKVAADGAYVLYIMQNPYNVCSVWAANAPASEVAMNEPSNVSTSTLTGEQLSKAVEFAEFIVQSTFPEEIRAMLRASILARWHEGNAEEIKRWLATWEMLLAQSPEERDLWRESNQQAYIMNLHANGDHVSRAIASIYDHTNAPIAPGNPPLTQEAADAALELFDFMAAVVNGVDYVDVGPATRQSWCNHLSSIYSNLPPAAQMWMGNAPFMLASVRSGWPQLPEPSRQMFRHQWTIQVQELGRIYTEALQRVPPTVTPQSPWAAPGMPSAPGMKPFGARMQTTGMPVHGEDVQATTGSPAAGGLIGDLMGEVIAEQKAQVDKYRDSNPELAMQLEMQHSQQNAQMMSQMSKMMHETSMAIVKNMSCAPKY